MNKQQLPDWAQPWFADIIEQSKFEVRTILLKSSKEWTLKDGVISHKSGHFFNIVGVSWIDDEQGQCARPLIEQREIGTLGFMLKNTDVNPQILVQAKIEPGNVGLCQIGPSFQATASNAACVHGGKTPPYKKYFEPGAKNILFQNLHSEQGTRFLCKLNRNITVLVKDNPAPTNLHKWVPVGDLLDAIDQDNFINTDSRSVLVCTPWDVLVGRAPFTKKSGKTSQQLQKSHSIVDSNKIIHVKNELLRLRTGVDGFKQVELTAMPSWRITNYGVSGANPNPYVIKQIAVTAHGREVSQWDQPIVDSKNRGNVDLLCALIDGNLRFYFVHKKEVGLINKVELSPSVADEPGQKSPNVTPKNSKVLASVNQSDEGGRFFRDVTRYRLVQLSDHKDIDSTNGHWLSLGEICELLKTDGIFTNEARSALSLLLKWL